MSPLAIGSEDEGAWPFQARQRFYRRLGFEPLDRPIIYANIHGEHKQAEGGLLAPLGPRALSERALIGSGLFAPIPETGYW